MTAYDQGDIVEVSFDPTVGHEPTKTRPAVIVSAFDFNLSSSLTVIAPITSVGNGYPLHVKLASGNAVGGFVCVEQLRSMDLEKRGVRLLGALDDSTMITVLSYIRGVFGV